MRLKIIKKMTNVIKINYMWIIINYKFKDLKIIFVPNKNIFIFVLKNLFTNNENINFFKILQIYQITIII